MKNAESLVFIHEVNDANMRDTGGMRGAERRCGPTSREPLHFFLALFPLVDVIFFFPVGLRSFFLDEVEE
jgi:hypothetical protein